MAEIPISQMSGTDGLRAYPDRRGNCRGGPDFFYPRRRVIDGGQDDDELRPGCGLLLIAGVIPFVPVGVDVDRTKFGLVDLTG